MHLRVGAGRLVTLTAEVQHPVYDDPPHLLQRCGAVLAGVVRDCFHVDEYVSRDDACALPVAVIERDDVGEIVVAEVLAVHLQQPLRRAENVVHIAECVTLSCGGFGQPAGREALGGVTVFRIVGVVAYHLDLRADSSLIRLQSYEFLFKAAHSSFDR